jgi:hypothetical protein
MAESLHYALARLLTQLVGRDVTLTLVMKPPPPKGRLLYGLYAILPEERALVVKAELALLARLGGALLGLPEEVSIERAQSIPMDESLRDAIHEVLNVASAALSLDHRVLFKTMTDDPLFCEGEASDLLRAAPLTSNFQVAVQGSTTGLLTILTGV